MNAESMAADESCGLFFINKYAPIKNFFDKFNFKIYLTTC